MGSPEAGPNWRNCRLSGGLDCYVIAEGTAKRQCGGTRCLRQKSLRMSERNIWVNWHIFLTRDKTPSSSRPPQTRQCGYACQGRWILAGSSASSWQAIPMAFSAVGVGFPLRASLPGKTLCQRGGKLGALRLSLVFPGWQGVAFGAKRQPPAGMHRMMGIMEGSKGQLGNCGPGPEPSL